MWTPAPIVNDREVIDETWGRELAEIETAYGRLVYLASLRDSNTGRYEHYAAEPGAASAYTRTSFAFMRLFFENGLTSP